MKLKTIKIKSKELLMQYITSNNELKLNYCVEENAGDSFNRAFVEDFFKKSVAKYTIGSSEHYLFCGSILSRANKSSIVIGAGLISESIKFRPFKKLVGCRGLLTLKRIHEIDQSADPVFLGDPGLLVKEVFCINTDIREQNQKKDKIGIIPHFVDYDRAKELLGNDERFMIINIKEDYKAVCGNIISCRSILSSSLHGLIFSDGLSVKNNWIKFSDDIVGGDFKFRDYYSVMDRKKQSPIVCKTINDIENAERNAFVSINPNYNKMLETIIEYFE